MEGDIKEGSREGLSRLLMEVLGEEEEEKDFHQDNDVARKSEVELREEVGCMEQAFSALCNGLVELSSMPKYQQEEDPDQETQTLTVVAPDILSPAWIATANRKPKAKDKVVCIILLTVFIHSPFALTMM